MRSNPHRKGTSLGPGGKKGKSKGKGAQKKVAGVSSVGGLTNGNQELPTSKLC